MIHDTNETDELKQPTYHNVHYFHTNISSDNASRMYRLDIQSHNIVLENRVGNHKIHPYDHKLHHYNTDILQDNSFPIYLQDILHHNEYHGNLNNRSHNKK